MSGPTDKSGEIHEELTKPNLLNRAAIRSKPPKNRATAGPREKSRRYANNRPPVDASTATAQAVSIRGTQREENRAEVVAGIMRKANTTTTPARRTAIMITAPTSA